MKVIKRTIPAGNKNIRMEICDMTEKQLKKATPWPIQPADGCMHLTASDNQGDYLITVGKDQNGNFCEMQDIDRILYQYHSHARYTLADDHYNVWQCRHCGHLARFESDGPFENGWKLCPHCGAKLMEPDMDGEAGEMA